MTVNIKNGPLAALLYAIGVDASNKGGRTRINSNATSAPLATNDNTQGYSIGATWTRSDTRQMWFCADATTNAAVWVPIELSDHPGYIVGNYYLQPGLSGVNVGSAPGANSIRLYPGYLKQRATLNSLGVRINTPFASGLVQAAVYAANLSTGRPTGNALASTGSMSTTSAGNINSAVSVQLDAGLYWWASNCDNGTAVFSSVLSTAPVGHLIGSTTASTVVQNSQGITGVTVAQTLGTWPDLTAGSFTENVTSNIPLILFKPASVP